MERQPRRGGSGRSGYLLGFELRPGHILQVAAADSLLCGQALLIQAVVQLCANGATDVVVCLIDAATGQIRERVPVTPAEAAMLWIGRRQIDLFSAGCVTCLRAIERVARLAAADGHDLRIHDMHEADVARRAEELGIRSVPAVAVVALGQNARPGAFAPLTAMTLVACCADGGPDAAIIRAALAAP